VARIHWDLRSLITDRSVNLKNVWRRWASGRKRAEFQVADWWTMREPNPSASDTESELDY
jgi:hypothetical protein